MTGVRLQPNERAAQLWGALRSRGKKGLSAKEAEKEGLASESYARKRMRLWADAGYLKYAEPEALGLEPGRYVMTAKAPKAAPLVTTQGEVVDISPAMSAAEFAAIRRKSGLSLSAFGHALGRTGHRVNISKEMRAYETGKKPILKETEEKVRELERTL